MDYDFFAQGKARRGLGILVCNSTEDDERDYSMPRQILSHKSQSALCGTKAGAEILSGMGCSVDQLLYTTGAATAS